MQDNFRTKTNDEIDLREIFAILWNHKILIIFTCAIGVCLGGYYALTIEKTYTSLASFKLSKNQTQRNAFSDSSGLYSILSGVEAKNNTQGSLEEVMGREFIEAMDLKLDFSKDDFFYNHNSNYKEPAWKEVIKKLIDWKGDYTDPDEQMWQSITNIYKNNIEMTFPKGSDGLLISVTHGDAYRSAEIANTIMQTLIDNSKIDSKNNQNSRLNYLSETLATAQEDLENALLSKKKFILEKSAVPLEAFSIKMEKLESLRLQLNRTSEIHNSLAELSAMLATESVSHSDYLLLREMFPIIDQVEFRRMLGQSEIISSWKWPDKIIVDAVFDTLTDRRKRLEAEVSAAQKEATKTGIAVEEFSALERKIKVAESTYTVLIEQVKAQSMLAGYHPDNSQVYEYAAPPLKASYPNRTIFIAIGAFLGLLIGCTSAYIFTLFRGVFYSFQALINITQAQIYIKAYPLISTKRMSLKQLIDNLPKKSLATLRELAVTVHSSDNNLVLFTSLNSKLRGSDVANALASYMQSDNMKIALINLSAKSELTNDQENPKNTGLFTTVFDIAKISVLQPNNKFEPIDSLCSHNFQDQIQLIQSNFDLIFLCADNIDAINLANVYTGQDVIHISLVRIKRTKSYTINKLRKLLPIQGLLYE
ncbi:Wzz/FepE/Etk N-terminal domain-containing protein [Amylibacter sp.]|nr:Wzz/FepE/Etk N-terminal domain-containing protein [Amylibacter sp.]